VQIPIKDACAGMVLSENVTLLGKVLLNRSEKLNPSLISLLKNCGVTSISIIGNDCSDPQEEDHDSVDKNNNIAVEENNKPENPSERYGEQTLAHGLPQTKVSLEAIPSEIHLLIDNNGMAAELVIEPVEGSSNEITGTVIRKALAAYSIVYGINFGLIDGVITQWSIKKERYVIEDIAVGDAAHPAIEGPVKMLVHCLTNRADIDRIKQLSCFHEAAMLFPKIERVATGMVIAERTIVHPAIPGIDIFGNAITTSETVSTEMVPGENAVVNSDNSSIIAQCDGIAYKTNATIGVIPISFDGSFNIEISSDRMFVKCQVIPPGPQGALPGKQTILNMLRDASVGFGINEGDIDILLRLCEQGTYPAEPFVIARGLAPVNGSDGDYIYHFKTETSLAPAINNDGSADYKSVNIVTAVERNQLLVTLVPPGTGHDGSDVFGKTLPAQPGKPLKLPRGAHTIPDPDNPTVLIAEIDGIARMNGGLVEVCEGFIVKNDVDFSTGNIDYSKTIIVNGDVKAGFEIHAGTDLQVNGTIEDCRITAGGNVLCRCGFVGAGRGCIEAKGDVNLNFIKNQCVRSFKTINVAKEAINSILQSRTAIIAHGNPLSVAGGELKARNSITVYTVGNHTGIRTLLEVGVDFLMVDELLMIEKQIAETTQNFKVITDTFSRHQKVITGKRRLTSIEQEKLNEITNALKQARKKLTVLEERRAIIGGKLYNVNEARIVIQHTAYPGTLLKFGDRHHTLREELVGPKTIMFTDDEIKIY
jgi:uncharacterized protein